MLTDRLKQTSRRHTEITRQTYVMQCNSLLKIALSTHWQLQLLLSFTVEIKSKMGGGNKKEFRNVILFKYHTSLNRVVGCKRACIQTGTSVEQPYRLQTDRQSQRSRRTCRRTKLFFLTDSISTNLSLLSVRFLACLSLRFCFYFQNLANIPSMPPTMREKILVLKMSKILVSKMLPK